MSAILHKGLVGLRLIGRVSFALLILAFVLLIIGNLAGARFNFTKSMPLGLYWVVDRPIERQAYVRFCPPLEGAFALAVERGYLSSGWGECAGSVPMIKRVSGVAGDHVQAGDTAVLLNGKPLPLSRFKETDGQGRPMPRPESGQALLRTSELWVMSDTNESSFDSRYFGPIDRAWVREVLTPVLTWGPGGMLDGSS